jgi:tripartite-type tricarboxylate transporter receptor subunit TctC
VGKEVSLRPVNDSTMKSHWLARASVVAFAVFTLASGTVMAQEVYPVKHIRIVVPYPGGGGVDTIVRIISSKLSENLRQPIIIDNRPGASGNIGTELAAKAAPDGYTLLAAFSSFASNATVYTRLPFDAVKDFAPITLLSVSPGLLVTHVSMPVKTVKEIIALAKKRPGEIMYTSSPGSGSPAHLAMELFNLMAGTRMTHVPYKGGPQEIVALMQGEVHLSMPSVGLIMPHVESGKVHPIAVPACVASK